MALKSPNVYTVGDTVWTDLYDASRREYVERAVKIRSFDLGGAMVGVERSGHAYVKPLHKLRRQRSE